MMAHTGTTGLRTIRAAILDQYVAVARFVGSDPFAILKDAQIDPRWLDDPDAPLALERVVQVLEQTASLSGRDDFGILLAESRAFSSIGPVGLLLEHEHTTRAVIQAAIEFRPMVNESLWIRVEERGEMAFLHFQVTPPYGSPQLMNNIVAVAFTVLVDASEGEWRPTAAHFRHAMPQCLQSYVHHFECELSFDSTFDGLSCVASTLDVANPSADPLLAKYARRLLNLTPEMGTETFVDHVRNVIYLLLRHGSPTLAKVAANLGGSARSVQRQIRSEGFTFKDVLNNTRRDLAIRYLAHSRQNMTQIAYAVGFADAGSFTRWFMAEFGVTPSVWRKRRRAAVN